MMINDKPFKFKKDVSPLKQIRESLSLSREQFAVELGTTANTVYRWETGRHAVSLTVSQVKKFRQLILRLGLDIDDLPDDIGPPSLIEEGEAI